MEPDGIIMLVDKKHDDETASALASCLRDIPADVYAVPTRRPKFWTAARPAEIGGIAGVWSFAPAAVDLRSRDQADYHSLNSPD
jgi:hypothetical protein